MKRPPLIILAAFVVVGLVAAGALWQLGSQRVQTAAISDATPVEKAEPTDFGGPFSLIDQDGKRRNDAEFRGKYMLIFFGYTFCPDVCPTTLAVEAEALDKIGARSSRIVPIFITVD